jgi:hypothetical protein
LQLSIVRGWFDAVVPPALELLAVREELLGHFSNEVVRLRLQWSDTGAPAPTSLIVKRRIQGRAVPASEGFSFEARVLGKLAAPALISAPRIFASSEEWLVMEELVDLDPFDFAGGASDAHVDTAMSALGRFHGQGRSSKPSWLPSFSDPLELRRVEAGFLRVWSQHRAAVEAIVPEDFSAFGDTFSGRRLDSVSMLGEAVVLHGDAHGENLPMQRGGIAFLDWASARLGPPAFDVAVFLGMSLKASRRRALERAGVERHAAAWAAAGGEPFADPFRNYARGLVFRAIHLISQVSDPALLANPGFALVTRRCAMAALDHLDGAVLDDG